MPLFQSYNRSTVPQAPRLVEAARSDDMAERQVNALKSQNMLGAAELYNAGMGDKSPIADSLFGAEATGTGEAAIAADAAGATGAELMAGAGAGAELAPITAAAAPATATATGAAAPGALAAMGPAGWAAMAALALGILG